MGTSKHDPEGRNIQDEAFKDDDFSISEEQHSTWFPGTLMQGIKSFKERPPNTNFPRLAILHNRITAEDTDYSDRYEANSRLASQLSEFFPNKWLLEITAAFRKTTQIVIKTDKDRVCSYLGYIELYLTFRGLTLLETTLTEINEFLHIEKEISMREVRTWKLKIIRNDPELKEQWIKIRARAHQDALFSAVVKVMNNELHVTIYSKEEVFRLKQECLRIAKEFTSTPKCKHVQNPEVWARAICAKAFRVVLPDCSCDPFPQFPRKTQKVIDNKRWQLDQIIK